jgi:hypothetical protein
VLKPLNPEGQCAPLVTAPDVRIVIEVSSYEETKIDELSASVKFSDKRFKRGAYATQTTARSDS